MNIDTSEYLPTIKQLVTHSSGYAPSLPLQGKMAQLKLLYNVFTQGEAAVQNPFTLYGSRSQLLDIIKNTNVKNKVYPFAYGNVNFSILGEILKETHKEEYTNYMMRFLKEELALKHTNFDIDNVILGYTSNEKRHGNWLWEHDDTTIASGGLYSDVYDMLQFAKYHNEAMHDYLKMMQVKLASGTRDYDMAFGWKYCDAGNVLWHNGGTGCFNTFMGINKAKQREIVILSNYRSLLIDKLGLELVK